ncbi:uncharacterized protein LOC126669131 [Mercurialis annua]|uniref:uncharacterized protein LOC126669131 n=1 Tax=Mercurialis annua TaxID=3986 RepID=UPI00215E8F3D|nr:uncharacterized protein LOC126669131 [Mercurialis annua]
MQICYIFICVPLFWNQNLTCNGSRANSRLSSFLCLPSGCSRSSVNGSSTREPFFMVSMRRGRVHADFLLFLCTKIAYGSTQRKRKRIYYDRGYDDVSSLSKSSLKTNYRHHVGGGGNLLVAGTVRWMIFALLISSPAALQICSRLTRVVKYHYMIGYGADDFKIAPSFQ